MTCWYLKQLSGELPWTSWTCVKWNLSGCSEVAIILTPSHIKSPCFQPRLWHDSVVGVIQALPVAAVAAVARPGIFGAEVDAIGTSCGYNKVITDWWLEMVNIPTNYLWHDDDWGMVYCCYTMLYPHSLGIDVDWMWNNQPIKRMPLSSIQTSTLTCVGHFLSLHVDGCATDAFLGHPSEKRPSEGFHSNVPGEVPCFVPVQLLNIHLGATPRQALPQGSRRRQ